MIEGQAPNKEVKAIERKISKLSNTVERLAFSVDELSKQLYPITQPKPELESTTNGSGEARQTESPFAERLIALNQKIFDIVSYLDRIKRNIQV